jgi:hypothetical protein
MADGTVGVKQNTAADRNIDNEVLDLGAGPVYRQRVSIGNALIPVSYDEIVLGYTGSDLTGVTYKQDGVTVAVLTLGYTDGVLTSVVRS